MNAWPQVRRIGRLLVHVRRAGVTMSVHSTPGNLRAQLGQFYVVVKESDSPPRVVPNVDLDSLEVWSAGAARAAGLGQPLPPPPWGDLPPLR